MPDDLVVAVLGTGTMGAAMAANIVKAGLGLRIWNREPRMMEPLAELGAVVCASPAEASRGADVILTPLANESVVAEVMDQARDGLDDAALWLGVGYVEAPLLGTKEPAVAGTLTILAATAQTEARDRVRPILDAVGSRTVWLDGVGQPSSLKLAYNAWVLTSVEGVAESLTLAKALGVDPKLVAEVIHGSALDSGYVQAKAPKMINGDLDTPSFPLVAAAKDAVLITDAARAAGLRLGIAETVRERLQLAVESGFGRADVAATYRVSRRVEQGNADDA